PGRPNGHRRARPSWRRAFLAAQPRHAPAGAMAQGSLNTMSLTKLGWNAALDEPFAPHRDAGLVPARVAVEDKHFFRIWTADAELPAQTTGKSLHDARGAKSKLRKVDDW